MLIRLPYLFRYPILPAQLSGLHRHGDVLSNAGGHQGLCFHHLRAVTLQVAVNIPAYQRIGRDKADGTQAQWHGHREKHDYRTNDGKAPKGQTRQAIRHVPFDTRHIKNP